MFLNKLKEVKEESLGAVEGCMPFLCKYCGNESLVDVVRGNVKKCIWRSITVEEAESSNQMSVMFVKYININNAKHSAYNLLKVLAQHKAVTLKSEPIIWASVSGILIEDVLFLKSKHRVSNKIQFNISTSEEVYIKHLGKTLNDITVKGRYDINTCSYYCNL